MYVIYAGTTMENQNAKSEHDDNDDNEVEEVKEVKEDDGDVIGIAIGECPGI